MLVVSVFDGYSGAQQALLSLGIHPQAYFASEVDKFAIQVTQKNFPKTIQIGDIKKIGPELPLLRPDLFIGGSPCQDLSIAHKGREGLNGASSGLFFEYVRLKGLLHPKYFVLENVASMKELDKKLISEIMGVEPILIDSSLVSAQSRKRLYWTNIPVEQPEDAGILLRDILIPHLEDTREYLLSTKELAYMDRRVAGGRTHWDFKHHHDAANAKSHCLPANLHKGVPYNVIIDQFGQKRKLTPVEAERLQGLTDDYTSGVSKSQRYKMLGNGFNIPTIAHILKGLACQK